MTPSPTRSRSGARAFHTSTAPDCTGPDSADFFALKAHYFQPSVSIERYAIFADTLFSDTLTHFANCHSGIPSSSFGNSYSEELGTNFVMALGFATQEKGFLPITELVGGTFMHELGHTLGLLHGGNDNDFNFKPNYLSVMNYLYQLGIPSADAVGSSTLTHFRLDYSGQALPIGGNTPGFLDESNFNEQAGFGSGTADLVKLATCVEGTFLGFRFVPTTGPIDYDGDGITTNLHASSIDRLNPSGSGCASAPLQLPGFNDWATISGNLAVWNNTPASITSITQAGGIVTLTGTHLGTAFTDVGINYAAGSFSGSSGTVLFRGGASASGTLNPDGSVSAPIPVGAQSGPVSLITPVGTPQSPLSPSSARLRPSRLSPPRRSPSAPPSPSPERRSPPPRRSSSRHPAGRSACRPMSSPTAPSPPLFPSARSRGR